ncbi:MAG: TAXI family TRAP transporter solute-binding subunit [Gammaproteobacteria bacterium]|nr:TAXI family TRAP transporter solute-binding subunit [Gammaproteobacteria bacterium]MDD9895108.1 TAXI family TRAP transporter solute-binding subunit [Gammaproteobacteria bacterium]MDD9959488.1 TAXI family TRAP transporter solute-binding subunit [Gammaproteobacteria bacterium]
MTRLHILVFFLLLTACSDQLGQRQTYVLTTGTTSATYYPVGVALATLVSAQEELDFSLNAISSAGSLENVKLLRDNQAQFSTMLSIFAAWSYAGEGPIQNPQEHIRGVTALWPNVEHLLLRTELVTQGTFTDYSRLNGERVSIGMRNSGAEITGFYIFDALGIDHQQDLSVAYLGYGPSADALQDGNIVGLNAPGGPPMAALTRAHALLGDELTILSINQEELDAINWEYPIWNFYELAPGTYPSQDATVRTAASANVLVARDDVPEEIVYKLTKLLWENLAVLQEIHNATKSMEIEKALQGIPVPLHKGALRYYREIGLNIPEHLLGG